MKTPIRSPSARLLAVQARLDALPRQAITAEQAKAQGIQHLAEAGAEMLKQAAESKAKRQALETPAGDCRLHAAQTPLRRIVKRFFGRLNPQREREENACPFDCFPRPA